VFKPSAIRYTKPLHSNRKDEDIKNGSIKRERVRLNKVKVNFEMYKANRKAAIPA